MKTIISRWPFFVILWILPVSSWVSLHDLPRTSKGGYWHYFGMVWIIPIVASFVMGRAYWILDKKVNQSHKK